MLDKSRFLAIKNVAKDIRKENQKVFKAFANDSLEDAIRSKEEFIESIFDSTDLDFSEGEQGKEEKQIFRANVLIPDDDEFFAVYSEDKNIRSLMNKYAVGIEDIMSKITELNIYGKYIEEANAEDDSDEFVDEMVDISYEDAESLLGEIEDLSSAIEEFTESLSVLDDENEFEEIIDDIIENTSFDETELEEVVSNDEPANIDDEFESMSVALTDFVNNYDRITEDLVVAKEELEKALVNSDSLKEEVVSLQTENNELRLENLDCIKRMEALKEENADLVSKNEVLEKKLKQASELLRKIYKSIPKK